MGMNVGGTRGAAISSINVTPMADVIIVLLIIFMVTIPVISRGEVDLPDATRARQRTDGPIVVTVRRDGSITLSGYGVVAPFDLAARLRERLAGRDSAVQLNADESLSYDRIAEVLAACRDAGAGEVAVMTEEG
jgi:biopolymer transport protein ExbD